MTYDKHEREMICTVCRKYGKPPVQTHGAWVTRAINNWQKATDLLKKHENSEWHIAALETQIMTELAKQSGDVMDMLVAASEEKKRRNRDLLKALIRSVYFLVKHHNYTSHDQF